MAKKTEKETRGRKPVNGIAPLSNTQRKQRQLERQLTRIAELPHTEYTKAECLLILQRKELKHLEKYAAVRLAELYCYSVISTKQGGDNV